MKYFVGICLPPTDSQALQDLRKRWPGRLADRIEPHITVVPPAHWENPSAWIARLQTVTERWQPFVVAYGIPNRFGARVLFLSVEEISPTGRTTDTPALRALHAALTRETEQEAALQDNVDWHADTRRYHPHISLAISSFGTPPDAMDALSSAAKSWRDDASPFFVAAIRVYALQGKTWLPYADLPFPAESML